MTDTEKMRGEFRGWKYCKVCNYSPAPKHILTERKHFDGHSYQCLRCAYTTETMPSEAEAKAAWQAALTQPTGDVDVEWLAQKLYECINPYDARSETNPIKWEQLDEHWKQRWRGAALHAQPQTVNAGLLKALRYYARSDNYIDFSKTAIGSYSPPSVMIDRGKTAREAISRAEAQQKEG